MKIETETSDFINKRLCQKMNQKHTSTTLMKQWVSTITYLQNE